MKRKLLLFSLLLIVPAIAVAADISGSWFFEQVNAQNGNKTHTYYVFKATGNTFTGRMVATGSQGEVINGVIDGNSITFDVRSPGATPTAQPQIRQFKGELKGDEITLTSVGGGGRGGAGGPGAPPAGATPPAGAGARAGTPPAGAGARGGTLPTVGVAAGLRAATPPTGGAGARAGTPTVIVPPAGAAPAAGAAARGGAARQPPPPTVLKHTSTSTDFNPPPSLAITHKPFPETIKPLPWNGLAKTPPMGWNSWNLFRARVDDKLVREIADAMVSSGMKAAGYVYVNIDDTWEAVDRDANGNIQTNSKFPDMKALADYVHSKGLKLGIYSGPGRLTCASYLASYGHEEQDAKTWAAWGIDYLKYDWCSARGLYKPEEMKGAYLLMGQALRKAGRPIVYSLCQYGEQDVGEWGAAVGGNLWRTTGDISDNWNSMVRIGFVQQPGREKFAKVGHWNDPDMLEIGNGGMSDTEYKTHMSLWSMLASPLLAGNDIRKMTPAISEILLNKEVIAIDQDKAGIQGVRVKQEGETEVWKKPLSKGTAVALFNGGAAPAKMTVKWAELGIKSKNPKVRDLWAHTDVKAPGEFTAEVPSHGVVMLRVQ